MEQEHEITPKEIYQITIDYLQGNIPLRELSSLYVEYYEQSQEYKENHKSEIFGLLGELPYEYIGDTGWYYITSFLLDITRDRDLFKLMLTVSIERDLLTKEQGYYVYWYLTRMLFLGEIPKDEEITDLMDDFYNKIYQSFLEEVEADSTYIPIEERDEDLVVVMTSQILSLNHGPTKTTLDRCSILCKEMHKKVFLINTAEATVEDHGLAMFVQLHGGYIPELDSWEVVRHEGATFAFYQCPPDMPQVPVINEIIKTIQAEKPLCIVSIGDSGIVSNICSKIVPVITIATVPSSRAMTYGQFQAFGKKVDEADLAWAAKHGLSKDHFIESIFTSYFKPQEHTYTRKLLGLPENGFLVILVGGRLDTEVDDGCLNTLMRLMEQGIYVGFMGEFNRYSNYISNPVFREHAIDLGFQEDAMAVYECFDLYLNPRRVGGGTSVAEALYKGLPVVTMDYGDGGLGAGKDFYVADYDAMYQEVLKYSTDMEYYQYKSTKARERAQLLTDSAGQFVKIMETAMSREEFQ